MISSCGISPELEFRIPKTNKRPWSPPKCYICLYELFFTKGNIWFPLPKFFIKYCIRRGIAFTQLTTAGICHQVGLLVLGAECEVPITVEAFEEMSPISLVKNTPGLFYVSMKPKYNLMTGLGSKVENWENNYFYVNINEASIINVNRH